MPKTMFLLAYKLILVHGFMRAFFFSELIDAPFSGMVSMVFNVFVFPITAAQDVLYGMQKLRRKKKRAKPFPFLFLEESYIAPIKNQNFGLGW